MGDSQIGGGLIQDQISRWVNCGRWLLLCLGGKALKELPYLKSQQFLWSLLTGHTGGLGYRKGEKSFFLIANFLFWLVHSSIQLFPFLFHVFWSSEIEYTFFRIFMSTLWIDPLIIMDSKSLSLIIILVLKFAFTLLN